MPEPMDDIPGLHILTDEAYTDPTDYTWRLLEATWTSERMAGRPAFWTYYDITELPPTVNAIVFRAYSSRQEAIDAIEADAKTQERARRQREDYRAWTVERALREANRKPESYHERRCSFCGRKRVDDAVFTFNPWYGMCDACQRHADELPDNDPSEEW